MLSLQPRYLTLPLDNPIVLSRDCENLFEDQPKERTIKDINSIFDNLSSLSWSAWLNTHSISLAEKDLKYFYKYTVQQLPFNTVMG